MKKFISIILLSIVLIVLNPSKFKEVDEYNHYWITDSIHTGRGITIHQGLLIGIRNNREAQFFYGKEGIDGFYSPYGPFLSFLNIPKYYAGHLFSKYLGLENAEREMFLWYSSIFLNCILLIIMLFIFYNVQVKYKKSDSPYIVLMMVMSSLLLYYAQSFYSEILLSFLILISFLFLLFRKQEAYFFLSGFFYGLAIITKINAVIFAPCFLLYIWLGEKDKRVFYKKSLMFFLPVLFFIMFYLNYNFVRFGSFFDFGYPEVDEFGEAMNVFVLNPFRGLYGLLLSPGKGIIFYFPLIVFYLINIGHFLRKEKNITIFSLSIGIISVIFHSFWKHFEAGTCFGSRFLVPGIAVVIFNMVVVGDFKEIFDKYKFQKWLFIFLVAGGLIVNIGGSLINFSHYAVNVDGNYYTGPGDMTIRMNLPEEMWKFAGDYNLGFNPFFGMYGYLWENIRENPEVCDVDFDYDSIYIASFEFHCFGKDLDISFIRFYKIGMSIGNIMMIYIYSILIISIIIIFLRRIFMILSS